jgi:hypothetical protein
VFEAELLQGLEKMWLKLSWDIWPVSEWEMVTRRGHGGRIFDLYPLRSLRRRLLR